MLWFACLSLGLSPQSNSWLLIHSLSLNGSPKLSLFELSWDFPQKNKKNSFYQWIIKICSFNRGLPSLFFSCFISFIGGVSFCVQWLATLIEVYIENWRRSLLLFRLITLFLCKSRTKLPLKDQSFPLQGTFRKEALTKKDALTKAIRCLLFKDDFLERFSGYWIFFFFLIFFSLFLEWWTCASRVFFSIGGDRHNFEKKKKKQW